MTEHWVVPSNRSKYRAEEALAALNEVDWSEARSAHIATGDHVHLYGTAPLQRLTHELVVIRTGIPFDDVIDDSAYWTDRAAFAARSGRTWMRLRLVRTYDERQRQALTLDRMTENGLGGAPQGRVRMPAGVRALVHHVVAEASPLADDAGAETAAADEDEVAKLRTQAARGDYEVPDAWGSTKIRGSAQRVFAEAVKANFGYRCAVTGITTPEFLIASHIVPWSADSTIRLDPANGICLSTLVDRAFDGGFLRITPTGVVEIQHDQLTTDEELHRILAPLDGTSLAQPLHVPLNPQHLDRRYHDRT